MSPYCQMQHIMTVYRGVSSGFLKPPLITPLLGGIRVSLLLPVWPSLTPWVSGLLLVTDGKDLDSSLDLLWHHPNEEGKKNLFIVRWGEKSRLPVESPIGEEWELITSWWRWKSWLLIWSFLILPSHGCWGQCYNSGRWTSGLLIQSLLMYSGEETRILLFCFVLLCDVWLE